MSHILQPGKKENTFSVLSTFSDELIYEDLTREELELVYEKIIIKTAKFRAKEKVFNLFMEYNFELRREGKPEIENEFPDPNMLKVKQG